MIKNIYTYSLIAVLLSAIMLPTYFSLTENKCDISLTMNDIEEDMEGEETETTKNLEIKLLHTNTLRTTHSNSENIQEVVYLSKEYASVHKKLESPPPKYLS